MLANGVGRLMRLNGIKPVRNRRHKTTTDSHHRLGVAANWLGGDFADILDLHSRRVVGWAVSNRMKKDLAIRALDMAVRLRQQLEGCFFHLDRGSQYC